MQKPKSIHISIPNPCGQAWDVMNITENGRHCTHCNKCVIDFTGYSDAQLYHFFANNTKHVCGRFLSTQLDRQIIVPVQPHSQLYRLFVALGLSLVMVTCGADATARRLPPMVIENPFYLADQDSLAICTIKGVVRDETKAPMIGAIVQAKQNGITKGGAATDEDGNFKISHLAPGIYDIAVQYQSYKNNFLQQVVVVEDRPTEANFCMELDPQKLNETIIIGYRIPLIDPY